MQNSQKLKVGLVFDDSLDSNDGVAQYVKTLGAWLSSQGHTVSYLVGESKLKSWHNGQVFSLAKNLPVRFNGNKLSIPLPASKQAISKALKTGNFNILHVMMPHSPFMAQKIIKQADNKTVVVGTFHIFPASWIANLGGRVLRLSYGNLKRFERVISVSRPAQQYAKQAFFIDSEIIPNPVDISKFSNSSQKPVPGQIVFLGRLVERKGCRYLIEAFSQLQTKVPYARLIIAGDGSQRRQLQALAAKLGISDKVDFKGYINESNKPGLLASAEIACFPSLHGESFGIVLIEAMAASSGVVLGGDNPGYKSVLADRPALMINPRNTREFAQRLEELLVSKIKVKELHTWQNQTVRQYDINVVGNKVLGMYYDAIARRDKNSHNKKHGIQKSNG